MSRGLLPALLLLGAISTTGTPWAADGPRRPDASDDPITVRFRWSAAADCSAHAHAEASESPTATARVINFGEEPIRDVEVCADRRCAPVGKERVLSPDEVVRVPLPGAGRLRVRCSVLLPSASG